MKIGLLDVIEMEQQKLMRFTAAHLATKYKSVYCDVKNYVYASGDNPMCLLAHTDTLAMGRVKPAKIDNIIYNPDGVLGADDRAGVFSILKILDLCERNKINLPSVIFTSGEEMGGIGMKEFIDSRKFNPSSVNLFVSLDRRHKNEFVYYSNDIPKDAKQYVKNGGFVGAIGSYSDVKDISEKYMIAGVNLSVGYYLEHTDHEHLKVNEMLDTIKKVVAMLRHPIGQKQELTKDMIKVVKYADWKIGDWAQYYSSGKKGYLPQKHYVPGTSYSNWYRNRFSTRAVAATSK